jgi:hypothetical protein
MQLSRVAKEAIAERKKGGGCDALGPQSIDVKTIRPRTRFVGTLVTGTVVKPQKTPLPLTRLQL